MNFKSSPELKALAREQLKGRFGVAIGAVLLTTLISVVVTIFTNLFAKTDSLTSSIIYSLITLIVSLLSAVLDVGLIRFFLKFTKNEKYKIGDIFWGFQNHPDKAILVTFLIALLVLLCMLPFVIFLVIFIITANTFSFVLSMVALIVGAVAIIFLGINYSQTYYLIASQSQDSVIEIMRASRMMMNGHKARYFYLQISFIGWYLLSILSCGIALLWIEPYRMCANSYFYLDLQGAFHTQIIDEYV